MTTIFENLESDLEHPEGQCLPSLQYPYLLFLPLHQGHLGTQIKASMWKTEQMEHWTAVGNINTLVPRTRWTHGSLPSFTADLPRTARHPRGTLDAWISIFPWRSWSARG